MKITLRKMLNGWMFFGVILGIVTVCLDANAGGNRALVYSGPGACEDGCIQAAYDMAIRNGLDPTYVGPSELNANTSEADREKLFKDVAIWIQPGGKSRIVFSVMTPQLVSAIRGFIKNGGGYVGFCAGMFSSTYMVGTSDYLGYNIFSGKTVLYKNRNGADILNLTWNGKKRAIYWEGGPYLKSFEQASEDLKAVTNLHGKVEVTAYYPNGQVASARSSYGFGRVYVTGAHPEAPQSWRDVYGLKDSDGLDYDLADEMIQWAMSR